MAKFIKIWLAGVVVYGLTLLAVSLQGLPGTIALIAMMVVIGFGYLDEAIKRLWERKQDRPTDEL